jgi:hypothetical protein
MNNCHPFNKVDVDDKNIPHTTFQQGRLQKKARTWILLEQKIKVIGIEARSLVQKR